MKSSGYAPPSAGTGCCSQLASQRVAGKRLVESGFVFATPDVESALMWALGQVPAHLMPPQAEEGGAQHGA